VRSCPWILDLLAVVGGPAVDVHCEDAEALVGVLRGELLGVLEGRGRARAPGGEEDHQRRRLPLIWASEGSCPSRVLSELGNVHADLEAGTRRRAWREHHEEGRQSRQTWVAVRHPGRRPAVAFDMIPPHLSRYTEPCGLGLQLLAPAFLDVF
jgi:hypothetical protein